uniref:Putative phosphoadenosine phosphosulfate reductase family protein n=1 Tax=viral metagenome TaxID=1070528 RepID=A0A6H1ZDR3_9ZZZZ
MELSGMSEAQRNECPLERLVSRLSVVSYGAGTNSTAMLVGLHERGERPDVILFADTGGERPETYRHRDMVSDWCESVGFPRIVTVAETETLEDNCLRRNALPGIAYGFRSCSDHYKIRPQKRWLKAQGITSPWSWVGIDAGEAYRAKYEATRYPLIEWDWGREECIEAIARAGLPQPGKSACFFCPSSRRPEILELKRTHPELFARAMDMEANAKLTSIKGLGRSFSWTDFVKNSDAQKDLFVHTAEIPCECFDG